MGSERDDRVSLSGVKAFPRRICLGDRGGTLNSTVLDSTARTRVEGSAASAASVRNRLRWFSLCADVIVMLVAYELALVIFSWFHDSTFHFATDRFDWGVPLSLAAIVVTFVFLGLYKLEAYVSRPLHLSVLAKGTVVALVITAFFEFTFKMPFVSESRLTVFSSFLAFFVLDAAARLLLVEIVYENDVRSRLGGTLVMGDGVDTSYVVARCRELRGFAPVTAIEALDKRRNGFDAEAALLRAIGDAEPAPRQVFLDTSTLGHKAVFDLIEAARARGCEVYVVGRLANALDTTHLLLRLFEMPVMPMA